MAAEFASVVDTSVSMRLLNASSSVVLALTSLMIAAEFSSALVTTLSNLTAVAAFSAA